MKPLSLTTLILLAGLLLAAIPRPLPAAAGTPASPAEWDKLVADAKKEGTVAIYAGPIGAARSAISDAFRKKYGINLDIIMGRGEEIVTKIESERRAGIYAVDVGIHGMTTFFNSVKPRKITVPITPLLVSSEVLDLSKWRGGKLPLADDEGHLAVLVLGTAAHLLVNTNLVKPGEIKSHQDLLNPKWKGKIVINDPSLGGAGTEWFTFIMIKVMGIDKGKAFMKELLKQEPAVSRDQRLLSESVARGKYIGVLGPDKATSATLIRAGAPLEYVDLKEPRPTGSGPGNLMVFDKAPHPNATKLFVNWLLSKEGSAVYSKAHGYASMRLDVSTEGIDPIFIPRADEYILGEDYQLSKGAMRKLAKEIFKESAQ